MVKRAWTEGTIGAYLFFGYLPKRKTSRVDGLVGQCRSSQSPATMSEEDCVARGVLELDALFTALCETLPFRKVIVPISGGMDSRAILAGIRRHGGKLGIETVTVGVPGSLDFEIGQRVSARFGLANRAVDLNQVVWDERSLLDYAGTLSSPVPILDGYLYSKIFDGCDPIDSVFISGFMGDPLSGSHLLANESVSWTQAIDRFLKKNAYVKSIELEPPVGMLPSEPLCSEKLLSFDEQLDFFVRQRFYIRPLVMPKGWNAEMPFLSQDWVRFMLALPREMRLDQRLYKKILSAAYPEEFALPVKSNYGLPIGASNLRVVGQRLRYAVDRRIGQLVPRFERGRNRFRNYIDVDSALRRNVSLRTLADRLITSLTKRRIVNSVDVEKLWKEHRLGSADYGDAISMLISLEVFLRIDGYRDND